MLIYWNVRKKIWSVKVSPETGVEHRGWVLIKNARFTVREAGRQRVIETKQKNIHAFVRGEEVEDVTTFDHLTRRVRYNPYETPTFQYADTGEPVFEAPLAMLTTDGAVYVAG